MAYNREVANSLELLLESLIKMVGRSNQNVDHLQRRVSQLESLLKEQQPERGPKNRILHSPAKASSQYF